ncbi:hypothetical protein Cgig2_022363 [Carnegiea gigantea]|uniref:Ubiquitin-like protease family profile domain-containing protein n=1 Tax=Carnegiea gigantea TaxID=171969 RepID=A0A9Q1KGE8_9CARY|nr:hypothetical protein Cgig2_022363 [Carnegiea gigantea]
MGLSGSGVDDREEVHVFAADACTPGLSAKHGSDRASNIVTRMKRKPRMRKASALRGSPYTDPLRGRRGTKTAHRREWSTAAGTVDPVNGHGKKVVRTAAVVPNQEVKETEVELGSRAVHDGEESMDFFSEEAVVAYLTHPLSPDEVQLLADVRDEYKGLKDGEWNFDLIHAREKHVNAEYLKGLINVVPARGAGDRPGRFCARLNCAEGVAADLGESFKKGLTSDVCNVFMPLFECVDEHWMLLVANLRWRQFLVYDSLLTKRALARTDLLNSGVSSPLLHYAFAPISRTDTNPHIHDEVQKQAVVAALSVATDYANARMWQTDHPLCPQQGNGHDCGVFVMVFMDLISMSSKPLLFNQRYMHHMRDKLLDDIACAYFHKVDPPYPQKAMDVIDELVAKNRELHDVLFDEHDSHYWMQREDMAVDNAVRADLARMKVILRLAGAMIVLLTAIILWVRFL